MKSKIKVLFFMISMGGVKRHICELISGLDSERFEIVGVFPDQMLEKTVVRSANETYKMIFDKKGLTYHILEIPRFTHIAKDIAGLFGLIRILNKEKPDVIHCHSSLAGAIGRIAGCLCRVPLVLYTPHCLYYLISMGFRKKIFWYIEKWLFHFCDGVIAVSHSEKERLEDLVGTEKRIFYINNGLEVNGGMDSPGMRKKLRETLGLGDQTRMVLSVTRLTYQKDVMTLLKAVELLPKDGLKIFIAGDGEEAKNLNNYARRAGILDRVVFMGWQDGVLDLLSACDIMVLSSRMEGLPYAALEASLMEKPVIGSNIDGIRDCLVHGETGLLFSLGDNADLADCLNRLLTNPDLCSRMGKNGRRHVQNHFSAEQMVSKHMKLYELAARAGGSNV
jgi:glycosyltransferase involved in cell wall biosynthesis